MKDKKLQYTQDEIRRLKARLSHKKKNADQRSIDFNLTIDDMYMVGFKLLGHGCCDYTNIPFSTTCLPTSPRYPTLERIDDKQGYIRGNICVVMQRANKLKDILVDKSTSFAMTDAFDKEIVKSMILFTSKEHMEKLKQAYIPKEIIENEEITDQMDNEDTPVQEPGSEETQTDIIEEKEDMSEVKNVDSIENNVANIELPDDFYAAQSYVAFSRVFSKLGMPVTCSFSHFKARFMRKRCPLSGVEINGGDKFVLLLDRSLGLSTDNFVITTKKMGDAMNSLMDNTGMTMYDLSKVFAKVE